MKWLINKLRYSDECFKIAVYDLRFYGFFTVPIVILLFNGLIICYYYNYYYYFHLQIIHSWQTRLTNDNRSVNKVVGYRLADGRCMFEFLYLRSDKDKMELG